MNLLRRPSALFVSLVLLFLASGCSTLKGWLTPEGHKLTQARVLLDQGHPLGATALAAEALALEAGYDDARDLLLAHFAEGQAEFSAGVARWTASTDALRWDRLVELYRWQQTLADVGPRLGSVTDPKTGVWLEVKVATVAADRDRASLEAAAVHRALAQKLLGEREGPRQARRALAEVQIAQAFAPDAPGLADEVAQVTDAATQKLMVVPFFSDQGGTLAEVPGALADEISGRLVDGPALPPLTTVFPAARLVTLPGAEKARQGRATQPDALDLAAAGGQNLVLLGQVTKALSVEPRRTVRVEKRTRSVNVVSPEHPNGVPKVWNAVVTYEQWSTAVQVGVSFSLVEVAGGRDVATGAKSVAVDDATVTATYTGDPEALTPEDLTALGNRPLVEPRVLRDRAVAALGADVAAWVRKALE